MPSWGSLIQRVDASLLRSLLVEHPDQSEVEFVSSGFESGFPLGLTRWPAPQVQVEILC